MSSSLNNSPPPLPSRGEFLLSLIATPHERLSAHQHLSKLGLLPPPDISSTFLDSSGSGTPYSTPSTPQPSFAPLAFTEAKPAEPVEPPLPPLLSPQVWAADDALPMTVRTASRAFIAGFFINASLEGFLPALVGRKSGSEGFRAAFSRNSTRVGSSLALFSLLYRTLLSILTRTRARLLQRVVPRAASTTSSLSKRSLDPESTRAKAYAQLLRMLRSALIAPFLAAFIAASTAGVLLPSNAQRRSPNGVLLPPQSQFPRRTLALYILTKGVQAAFLEARKADATVIRWVPKWIGGAMWYALGNGQLLWAFLFEPDCFPTAHGNFILSRSRAYIAPRPPYLPSSVPWPSGRQIADTIATLSTPARTTAAYPTFTSPLLCALTPSKYATTEYPAINPILDYAPAHPAHTKLLCAVLHPTEPSCSRNALSFFSSEWLSAARFFAGFAAIPFALRWRSSLAHPETALFRYASAVLQGATVMSGSIGTAWALVCFWQHYLPRAFLPRARYFLNGVLCSIFILAVPPARRSELGLYVGRMSAMSTWSILEKRKRVRGVRNGDVALLALGTACLLALYEARPRALGSGVRSAIARLAGPGHGQIAAARAAAAAGNRRGSSADGFSNFALTSNASSSGLDLRFPDGKEKREKRNRKARFDV